MKHYIKAIFGTLILISSLAHADESTMDKAKNSASEMWKKTKTATSDMFENTSEKASEIGEKASDFGHKASKNAKETGTIVWDKMKDAGTATAEGARKGASKIKSLMGEECKEDSALCYKDKE